MTAPKKSIKSPFGRQAILFRNLTLTNFGNSGEISEIILARHLIVSASETEFALGDMHCFSLVLFLDLQVHASLLALGFLRVTRRPPLRQVELLSP